MYLDSQEEIDCISSTESSVCTETIVLQALVFVKIPEIVVAREALNARTEINSLTNGNDIQRYLEQRRSTLGEKRGKGVDRYI